MYTDKCKPEYLLIFLRNMILNGEYNDYVDGKYLSYKNFLLNLDSCLLKHIDIEDRWVKASNVVKEIFDFEDNYENEEEIN